MPDATVIDPRPNLLRDAPATRRPPYKVRVPVPEQVRELYLEVCKTSTGTVVTVLELLSPANKRRAFKMATF